MHVGKISWLLNLQMQVLGGWFPPKLSWIQNKGGVIILDGKKNWRKEIVKQRGKSYRSNRKWKYWEKNENNIFCCLQIFLKVFYFGILHHRCLLCIFKQRQITLGIPFQPFQTFFGGENHGQFLIQNACWQDFLAVEPSNASPWWLVSTKIVLDSK